MLGRPLKLKEGDGVRPRYKNTGDIRGTVTIVGLFMVRVLWDDGKETWEEPQQLSRYKKVPGGEHETHPD